MYFDATMNRLQRKHHPFTELVSFYEKVSYTVLLIIIYNYYL